MSRIRSFLRGGRRGAADDGGGKQDNGDGGDGQSEVSAETPEERGAESFGQDQVPASGSAATTRTTRAASAGPAADPANGGRAGAEGPRPGSETASARKQRTRKALEDMTQEEKQERRERIRRKKRREKKEREEAAAIAGGGGAGAEEKVGNLGEEGVEDRRRRRKARAKAKCEREREQQQQADGDGVAEQTEQKSKKKKKKRRPKPETEGVDEGKSGGKRHVRVVVPGEEDAADGAPPVANPRRRFSVTTDSTPQRRRRKKRVTINTDDDPGPPDDTLSRSPRRPPRMHGGDEADDADETRSTGLTAISGRSGRQYDEERDDEIDQPFGDPDTDAGSQQHDEAYVRVANRVSAAARCADAEALARREQLRSVRKEGRPRARTVEDDRAIVEALHLAARDGNLQAVRNAVEKEGVHAHAGLRDHRGRRLSAIQYASKQGNMDVVQYLTTIEDNPDLNQDGLYMASHGGQLEVVQYLAEEKGADVHAGHEYALCMSCFGGNVDIARYLVEEHGANPRVQDVDGNTPLHWACSYSHAAVCRYLITRDVTLLAIQNKNGKCPTQVAHRQFRVDVLADIVPSKIAEGVMNTVPVPAIDVHVIGASGVGKTRMICSLTDKEYTEKLPAATSGTAGPAVDALTGRKLGECTLGVNIADASFTLEKGFGKLWSMITGFGDHHARIHDYSGRAEFVANIGQNLPQSTVSVILVVVSLAMPRVDDCVDALRRELQLVRGCCGLADRQLRKREGEKSLRKSTILVVAATHEDAWARFPDEVDKRQDALEEALQEWFEETAPAIDFGDADEDDGQAEMEYMGEGLDDAVEEQEEEGVDEDDDFFRVVDHVFCLDARMTQDNTPEDEYAESGIIDLRFMMEDLVLDLQDIEEYDIPQVCEHVSTALRNVRGDTFVPSYLWGQSAPPPCQPRMRGLKLIHKALADEDQEVSLHMVPRLLDQLERTGQILTLPPPGHGYDRPPLVAGGSHRKHAGSASNTDGSATGHFRIDRSRSVAPRFSKTTDLDQDLQLLKAQLVMGGEASKRDGETYAEGGEDLLGDEDEPWLVLDVPRAMHIMGRLQASPELLAAHEVIPPSDVIAADAMRRSLVARQAQGELVLSAQELELISGCNDVFSAAESEDDRVQLMLRLLQRLSMCAKVLQYRGDVGKGSNDEPDHSFDDAAEDDVSHGSYSSNDDGDLVGEHPRQGRHDHERRQRRRGGKRDALPHEVYYFPLFAEEFLNSLPLERQAELMRIEPNFVRVGRRFRSPDDPPGVVFPPGAVGRIQVATIQFVQRFWRIGPETADERSHLHVQLFRDGLIVQRIVAGACCDQVMLRCKTFDTVPASRHNASPTNIHIPSVPSYHEIMDVVVTSATHDNAAWTLLEVLREHVFLRFVPWLSVFPSETEFVLPATTLGGRRVQSLEHTVVQEMHTATDLEFFGCHLADSAAPCTAVMIRNVEGVQRVLLRRARSGLGVSRMELGMEQILAPLHMRWSAVERQWRRVVKQQQAKRERLEKRRREHELAARGSTFAQQVRRNRKQNKKRKGEDAEGEGELEPDMDQESLRQLLVLVRTIMLENQQCVRALVQDEEECPTFPVLTPLDGETATTTPGSNSARVRITFAQCSLRFLCPVSGILSEGGGYMLTRPHEQVQHISSLLRRTAKYMGVTLVGSMVVNGIARTMKKLLPHAPPSSSTATTGTKSSTTSTSSATGFLARAAAVSQAMQYTARALSGTGSLEGVVLPHPDDDPERDGEATKSVLQSNPRRSSVVVMDERAAMSTLLRTLECLTSATERPHHTGLIRVQGGTGMQSVVVWVHPSVADDVRRYGRGEIPDVTAPHSQSKLEPHSQRMRSAQHHHQQQHQRSPAQARDAPPVVGSGRSEHRKKSSIGSDIATRDALWAPDSDYEDRVKATETSKNPVSQTPFLASKMDQAVARVVETAAATATESLSTRILAYWRSQGLPSAYCDSLMGRITAAGLTDTAMLRRYRMCKQRAQDDEVDAFESLQEWLSRAFEEELSLPDRENLTHALLVLGKAEDDKKEAEEAAAAAKAAAVANVSDASATSATSGDSGRRVGSDEDASHEA